jgi:flavin reductase (DIM6/NTAB) family NADH-FMN oxidoreductase RutF
MTKKETIPINYLYEMHHMLRNGGLLLVSVGSDGKPNVMTIGWGLIGTLWSKPVYMVAVRKSRYTHALMEETGDFTVNVPKKGMEEITKFCGTVSGRDHDKFKEARLTPIQGRKGRAPSIGECIIHFECRTVGKLEVTAETISKEVLSEAYPSGAPESFHTLYFGEIISTYAENDAKKKLGLTA